MASWFANTPIPVRDDGQEEILPALNEDGTLQLDENKRPVQPYVPERPAWPEGAKVLIKSRVKGGDINQLNELRMKMQMTAKANDPDEKARLNALKGKIAVVIAQQQAAARRAAQLAAETALSAPRGTLSATRPYP